jgi:hypothetical protein
MCDYYKKLKKELTIKYFDEINDIKDIKILCDELTEEYKQWNNNNFYDIYLRICDDYSIFKNNDINQNIVL